jgi:hypothetical protein
MPFSITVSGDTLEDCIVALAKQLQSVVALANDPAPARAADDTPSPAPTPQPEQAPPPAAPKAADPEALRTEIRAVLTPHMRGDRAAEAKALVKKFGPSGLSSVPEDSLAALLSEVKETFK